MVSGNNLSPYAPLTWVKVIPDSRVMSLNLAEGTSPEAAAACNIVAGLSARRVKANPVPDKRKTMPDRSDILEKDEPDLGERRRQDLFNIQEFSILF
jgi:hypothetical protein